MSQLWCEFLRYYALQSNRGAIRSGDGIEAAWVHSLLPVNNGTFLTRPVVSEADLRKRFQDATADAVPAGLPWFFFLYEPLLAPDLVPNAEAILKGEGYQRVSGMRVMTADALAAPLRPLPTVEFHRIDNPEEARAALDLNVHAYHMPPEMTGSVLESNAYFANPAREFGYVAYADGEPVSTAAVLTLNDWLYVEVVATAAAHQRKGYAEAVIRHALAEAAKATGLTRTALDASAMGHPLYLQMGYRDEGAAWHFYMRS